LNSAESALPKGGKEGGKEGGMLGSYHPAQVVAVFENLQVRKREGGREAGREGVRGRVTVQDSVKICELLWLLRREGEREGGREGSNTETHPKDTNCPACTLLLRESGFGARGCPDTLVESDP